MFLEISRKYGFPLLIVFLVLGTAFAVNQTGTVGNPPYNSTFQTDDLVLMIIDGVGTAMQVAVEAAPLIAIYLLVLLLI